MLSVRIATLFDTPPQARMSAEDYIASPQSEHKSDLIEGVFVMASPARVEHEDVQQFVDHHTAQLCQQAQAWDGCWGRTQHIGRAKATSISPMSLS